jgi:hypothetical protein
MRRAPMTSCTLRLLRLAVVIAIVGGATAPALFAQGPLPDAPTLSFEPAPPVLQTPSPVGGDHEHAFWDAGNGVLFTMVAATSGMDFAVTRANLQSGGRELNPIVRVFGRSTPGLAVNFCGEIVGVIGVSYFLHKTGHHKLERAVSMVNIGISVGAASFGMTHR